MGGGTLDSKSVQRSGNKRVRLVVRADTNGRLPFFCECGQENCRRSLWLSLQEAADVIDSGGIILAAHPTVRPDIRGRVEAGSRG